MGIDTLHSPDNIENVGIEKAVGPTVVMGSSEQGSNIFSTLSGLLLEKDGTIEKGENEVAEVARQLSGLMGEGQIAKVGSGLNKVLLQIIKVSSKLGRGQRAHMLTRFRGLVDGLYGKGEYRAMVKGVLAEVAVKKSIEENLGLACIEPTIKDDMNGVDLWVDISKNEDGNRLLALQLKNTRFVNPEPYFFTDVQTFTNRDRVLYYFRRNDERYYRVKDTLNRLVNHSKEKSESDKVEVIPVVLLLSSGHGWYNEISGKPTQDLNKLLEKEILEGFIFDDGPQNKGDKR